MMKCITLTPNLSLTLTNPNPKKALNKFQRLSAGPQMTVTRTQALVASAPSACNSRLSPTHSARRPVGNRPFVLCVFYAETLM